MPKEMHPQGQPQRKRIRKTVNHLSSYLFAFDWEDDAFACSKSVGISNLLSLSASIQ
jgi:hypothetical protein